MSASTRTFRRTTTSNSNPTSNNNPLVLTHNAVLQLVQGLDASDALECYFLTRQTPLQGFPNLTISQAALGLRQRMSSFTQQTAASAPTRRKKRPLAALTLEYGPSRATTDLQQVALPKIFTKTEDVGGTDTGTTSSEVSWENESKIYYTTHRIDAQQYPTANYLGSVSGAALQTLLERALDYTQRHRRYQPFTVVDARPQDEENNNEHNNEHNNNNQRVWGHSQSSADFVLYLYQQLAALGVSLEPVLLPQHYQLQLHALTVQQVQVGHDVQPSVLVDFYRHLQTCVHSLVTADITLFAPKEENEEEEQQQQQEETATVSPTPANSEPDSNNNDNNNDRRRRLPAIESSPPTTTATTAPDTSNTTNTTTTAPSIAPTNNDNNSTAAPSSLVPPLDPQHEAQHAAQQAQQAAHSAQAAGNKDAAQAAQAAATAAQHAADLTTAQLAAMHQQWIRSKDGTSMVQAIRLCFQQAEYGLQNTPPPPAAANAENSTDTDNTEEDNTKENSDKDAATTAPAGDTTTTTGTVTNQTSSTVYLYWDGTFYLQLELVEPYISLQPLQLTLPQPSNRANINDNISTIRGDFVDWSLAFLIGCLFLLGCLLLLQQLLGKNMRGPLYQFQKWLFDPRGYLEEQERKEQLERQLQHLQQSESSNHSNVSSNGMVEQEYTFGEDVIPLSMGGRRAPFPLRRILSRDKGGHRQRGRPLRTPVGDVELTHLRRRTESHSGSVGGDGCSNSSNSSEEDIHHHHQQQQHRQRHHSDDGSNDSVILFEEDAPTRLFRDPDLVDLPDLKSYSKVAVPVSMGGGSSQHSIGDVLHGDLS